MKSNYMTPLCQIDAISLEDVIRTSGDSIIQFGNGDLGAKENLQDFIPQ